MEIINFKKISEIFSSFIADTSTGSEIKKKLDRVCIEFLLKKECSYTTIGIELGLHRTTIQREVLRNSVDTAVIKQSRIRKRNSKIKYRILDNSVIMKRFVITHLKKDWSPEQIDGTYKTISHMTIYRFLDRNKSLKKFLQ